MVGEVEKGDLLMVLVVEFIQQLQLKKWVI